ncbi:HAMP domain-containing sensor histidine kinase [Actinomadura sp. 6K520]|uniref:sensor histidine kinase n=1 Tax=Actinomadura sp. 6K520 TaxID=2530364 RepID=UPI001047947F|nr:HAMP domain-containing sensor histidine kinase [Actinomadura sp. 6K520]TDE20074.1 HAMP domain-containing histidine kinase [Actinomadura sp. 6K520]
MTLNARLLSGLLAITVAGLAIMALVSALVLNGYLMHRVDEDLQAVPNRAMGRLMLPETPRGVAPSRFIILVVDPTNQVRALSGDEPDPSRALNEVQNLSRDELTAHASTREPFSLPGLRAVARPWRNSIIVVASPLDQVHSAVRNLVLSEIATGIVLLTLLALLGRTLIGRGLLPLNRMAATAHAITAGGDLRARMPDPGPRTETARLAAAINVMLERIEQAFWARSRSEARVREFAADASHELRTPLTTIQGYAELYRHGALGPDELPDAMRRIEDEARRMNKLVTDLLDLARLDREASLRPAPTDLVALARDAIADATAADPDRPLTLDAPDTLHATVDESRIRQVFANLLANIRAHTPPGTPATIHLAPGIIEVTDKGPGMQAADAARAFERFHRAEHGTTGTGLGLPIVAAIAAAHGGRAELLSAPSRGTTVRITLPHSVNSVQN